MLDKTVSTEASPRFRGKLGQAVRRTLIKNT
jgi:hypothetical protein